MKKETVASWMIGLGLVLFVWHNPNQPLLQYAFLPWIGNLLLVLGVILVLKDEHPIKLGEKKIWIPLSIIAGSMAISGVWQWVAGATDWNTAFGSIALAGILFGLYLACRKLGTAIYKPMAVVVIVESLSIIVFAATHNWIPNGGLLSPTNYDIATGLVIFGVLVSKREWQWWLSCVAVAGLLFSGSAEALFVGLVMLIAVFIGHRKSLNWKHYAAPAVFVVAVLLATLTGVVTKVQAPNVQRLELLITGKTGEWTNIEGEGNLDAAFGYRATHFKLSPIKPFGYGVNLTEFYWGIPHNIFLIIIEQVGILAMLAWVWVAGIGLKRKPYIWIGLIALGIFDHFIFTQAAPWYWALAGTSLIGGQNALR